MRILFASTPGAGHTQPLLGLALAARRRGHRIAWATAVDAWPLLASHGIETFEAGVPFGEAFSHFARRWPEALQVAPRAQAGHHFARLFGACIAEAMLPPLRRAAQTFAPDWIVHEPAALAAPLAAAACGIRNLTHAYGLPMPGAILQDAGEAMAPAWRAAGLEPPEHTGLFTHAAVEIAPAALLAACPNPVRAQCVLAQRPAAVSGGPGEALPASLTAFIARGAGRPLVYATFGSLNRGGAAFAALLRALAGIDANVIVTTGSGATQEHLAGPNSWTGAYAAQELVLPHCAAVISHAGSGIALAALAAGLPQLCLPQGADQFRNADALAACGAALVLEAESPGEGIAAASIVDALHRVLADDGLRRNALRLRAQVDAMPTPDDTAAGLERL